MNRNGILKKIKVPGGLAQLGEHLPCKQGVMSSNLTISIRLIKQFVKRKAYIISELII